MSVGLLKPYFPKIGILDQDPLTLGGRYSNQRESPCSLSLSRLSDLLDGVPDLMAHDVLDTDVVCGCMVVVFEDPFHRGRTQCDNHSNDDVGRFSAGCPAA